MTATITNLQEAVKLRAHFVEASSTVLEEKDMWQYRRLSAAQRDLPPLTYAQTQKLSFRLWQRNPLANSMLRVIKDFCVGDEFGVTLKIMKRSKAGDKDTNKKDAQQIWLDFYEDPINKLDQDIGMFVQDFLLNGELICPATVNSTNGKVRIGYIDPMNVAKVINNPLNQRETIGVVFKLPDTVDEKTMSVVHMDIDPNSDTFEKRVGETFYWRMNRVINQTRGHGELVTLIDWLDSLDQFLFDALFGFRLRNAFFYQAMFEGLTEEQLKAKQSEVFTPPTGSTVVTNEKVKWDVVTPDLKAVDVNQAFKTFLSIIVGIGKNMPPTWFGVSEDSNLATAQVMSVPTMRMLRSVQKSIKTIIKDMAYFITDQAAISGKLRLGKDEYIDCEITMFDFEKSDSAVIAAAFVQTVTALSVAEQNNWVAPETSKKIINGIIGRMGVEVSDEDIEPGNVDTTLRKIYDKANRDAVGAQQ